MLPDKKPEKKVVNDKREKIMQAAINVFAGHGFFNSTVADVAKVAQVADGTIYLYFKNKDDLLISIFEQSMDMFIEEVSDKVKEAHTPQEKLLRYITLHLQLVQKNQNLAQVIQIELRQSSKFMKEYANEKFFEYMNILQLIIEEGQRQNIFRRDADPVILKRAIFGAIDEMALEWVLMKRKRYSIEDAAEQIYKLFTIGLNII